MGRRLADFFQGRPRLTVAALLAAPLGWLVIGYLGSLAVMLVASFWHLGELSGEVQQGFSLENYQTLVDEPVYRTIAGRTILVAALVTLTDAVLAFPIAFYMAKVAKPRLRSLLVVAVLLPLWSSYLVKVGAWRLMLSENGAINWALEPFGLQRARLRDHRRLAGHELHVAAVHDHPDLRRPRADPRLDPLGLRGPRRQTVPDLPQGDPSAWRCRR